jgi:D-3-phosphoglycerate dehydrogenase
MTGVVGVALGDAGVNVADMVVGHVGYGHSAIMVLSTGGPVPTPVLDDLRRRPGIISVRALDRA